MSDYSPRNAARAFGKLQEVIRSNIHLGVNGIARAIDQDFTVIGNLPDSIASRQPKPELNQVWKSRATWRHVKSAR